ncbi:exodeoxyribonuclease VII large subunit [Edaphobacter aggregans]|uniref:exodeoxyribonuclease VII large subunit n=1 Tax=Edaphobacter aggregans TaxID=570835 RepID=UPI0009FE1931|nr:exodeoxyribonuclease VII large subunit [Edaphobacter aggregans]
MAPRQENPPPTLASLRAGRTPPRSPERQSSLIFTQTPPPSAPEKTQQTERRIWTVASLVSSIRRQVETSHTDLWVEGEISNCRPAPSGHIYFTLKDANAQLPVVLFRREAQLLRFRPADGLAVLVRGRISVYESRGQLQLIAETMEPRGAGGIQLAFEQLKARLLAEGLFDAARKRPLPAFPRCIGVITSPTGAVLRDIVTVVHRRHAPLNLLVHPAVMQGPTSPSSVARAIRWFNANPRHADLILIARGGGSLEDLACFNDEALARIIAASKIPTVSAIGHETDFTIADFVADLRAPTPSAAAEIITAAQHRIEERVLQLSNRVRRAIRLHLLEARQRYARLSASAVLRTVTQSIQRRSQRVDELSNRLDRAIHRRHRLQSERLRSLSERLRRQQPSLRVAAAHRRLDRANTRLDRAASALIAQHRARLAETTARLQALSPLNVLSRGYALVYNADGTLLRSAAEASPGQTIHARLAEGSLTAQVTSTNPTETSKK